MNAYIRFVCPLEPNTRKAIVDTTGHIEIQVDCESASLSFAQTNSSTPHTLSVTNPIISYSNSKNSSNRGLVDIYSNAESANHFNEALLCKYRFSVFDAQWNALKQELEDSLVYDGQRLLVKESTHPLYTYNKCICHCMYAAAYWCKFFLGFDGLMVDYYEEYTNPDNKEDEGYENYMCWKIFADKCKYLIYDMLKLE